jgi:hypothetical protein
VASSYGAANSRSRRTQTEHDGTATDARGSMMVGLMAVRPFAGSGGDYVARSAGAGQNRCIPLSRCAESGEILKRPVPSLVDWLSNAEN